MNPKILLSVITITEYLPRKFLYIGSMAVKRVKERMDVSYIRQQSLLSPAELSVVMDGLLQALHGLGRAL